MTSQEVHGYIYRIFIPGLVMQVGENRIQLSYVGQTKELIKKRFNDHMRDSKSYAGSKCGGDGKLRAVMNAYPLHKFKIEELAIAYSDEELCKLESEFIKKYDSKKTGWNKISAPLSKNRKGQNVSIVTGGITQEFESMAQLRRRLKLSDSSIRHWLKKGLSLSDAVHKSLYGKENNKIIKNNQMIEIFKRTFPSTKAAAKDKRVNKLGLSSALISKRLREGMTPEDAFSKPKQKGIEYITIKLPSGESMRFDTIKCAHNKLTELNFSIAAYQTVVSYLNKGYTPEQSFGFEKRPWEFKFKNLDQLVLEEGFEFIGKKHHLSIPVAVDFEKKIYLSIGEFCKAYGLDFTTAAENIKKGMSIEEILKKSGHIQNCSY